MVPTRLGWQLKLRSLDPPGEEGEEGGMCGRRLTRGYEFSGAKLPRAGRIRLLSLRPCAVRGSDHIRSDLEYSGEEGGRGGSIPGTKGEILIVQLLEIALGIGQIMQTLWWIRLLLRRCTGIPVQRVAGIKISQSPVHPWPAVNLIPDLRNSWTFSNFLELLVFNHFFLSLSFIL